MKEIQKKYKRTNKNTVFIGLILLAFFFLTAATLSWYGTINYDSATGVFSFKTTPQTPNTYVVDLNEADIGAVGSGRSLKDILTTIGTSVKAKVIFERGSSGNTTLYTVSTTYDASAYTNVIFEFQPGAMLSVAVGVTLTLPAPANIIAQPNQQIKTGSGTLAFSVPGEVNPKWWGATGDGTTDDTTALQASFTAASGGTLNLEHGSYVYTTKITVPINTNIIGYPGKSILMPNGCIALELAEGTSKIINIKDFTILGNDDTSTATGIGIRSLGTADTDDTNEHLRISNIHIYGLNTGMYFRNTRDIDISGCFIYTYNGIKFVGQVVVGRIHNNDIIYDSNQGSSTSYGVLINSAFDYDPGGSTEQRPEDIQVYQNRIFGFSKGVTETAGLHVQILDNDIDQCTIQGINLGGVDGGENVQRNWINMAGVDATDGIYLTGLASLPNRITTIRDNYVSCTNTTTGASYGINFGASHQSILLDGNTFIGFKTYDIYVDAGVSDLTITNNYCYSDVSFSLFLTPQLAGLIKVDGNYFRGSVYFHPTSSLATLDMGFNQGTYSTRIRGMSTMAQNGTTVSTNFSALNPTPPNIATMSSGSWLTAKVIIYGPDIQLGDVWGTADETSVTINCESSSHAATNIYWEVVLFPNFH